MITNASPRWLGMIPRLSALHLHPSALRVGIALASLRTPTLVAPTGVNTPLLVMSWLLSSIFQLTAVRILVPTREYYYYCII